jgi:hypothetical protein
VEEDATGGTAGLAVVGLDVVVVVVAVTLFRLNCSSAELNSSSKRFFAFVSGRSEVATVVAGNAAADSGALVIDDDVERGAAVSAGEATAADEEEEIAAGCCSTLVAAPCEKVGAAGDADS